jgi:hypothetical protein
MVEALSYLRHYNHRYYSFSLKMDKSPRGFFNEGNVCGICFTVTTLFPLRWKSSWGFFDEGNEYNVYIT